MKWYYTKPKLFIIITLYGWIHGQYGIGAVHVTGISNKILDTFSVNLDMILFEMSCNNPLIWPAN